MIKGKPKVRRSLKDTEVEQGNELKLEADIYAEPEANISWFHNGQDCSADARFKIIRDSHHSETFSMTVNICKPEDAGTYEIRAKNMVGESTSTCQVIILSK